MDNQPDLATPSWKDNVKALGPGLLFASTAIGTSHLVLSTRAGAHHGYVFIFIIVAVLILKYPFFEFGTRYAAATGRSLLHAYRNQGLWAVGLYLGILTVTMFAVTGALASVSAGILSTLFGLESLEMSYLVAGLLLLTAPLLLIGRYKILDQSVKALTVILLVTVTIVFIAVLIKGPADKITEFDSPPILEGAGLTLLVGLVGWMPSGIEASVFNSIWSVEKMKAMDRRLSLTQCLFDFNLGYVITSVLALMFLVIGIFTVYGTGNLLEGNAAAFSAKLLAVFTAHIGGWSAPIIGIAAFGTIYGTLIATWDAFARGSARCLAVLRFSNERPEPQQLSFLTHGYNFFVPVIGLGAFFLFTRFSSSMVAMLEFATVASFVVAPIVAVLNTRALISSSVGPGYRPGRIMLSLSYIGIVFLTAFGIYYLITI